MFRILGLFTLSALLLTLLFFIAVFTTMPLKQPLDMSGWKIERQ